MSCGHRDCAQGCRALDEFGAVCGTYGQADGASPSPKGIRHTPTPAEVEHMATCRNGGCAWCDVLFSWVLSTRPREASA